jgi:hypothetical protein
MRLSPGSWTGLTNISNLTELYRRLSLARPLSDALSGCIAV